MTGARSFGEDSQILVPESFIALHASPSGRLTVTKEELLERYELCEDMAQALVEQCRMIHFRDGVDEGEVLRRVHAGLLVEPAVLTPAQVSWVVQRCAELLDWPIPSGEA
jgi:hypothetical protein